MESMRIVLVGEESAGAHVLRWLVAQSREVVAVLTGAPESGAPRGPVAIVARANRLRVEPAVRVREPALAAELRAERIDLLLNVHALHVIHPDVLDAVRIGAFNLHPGPLPRYAGLNGPSWAILRGETTYGVTVHRMVPRVDAGPICFQTVFPIGEDETALNVALRCTDLGIALVSRLVDVAARDPGAIPAVAQDLSQREYFGRQVPRRGAIDWAEPAARVAAFVRAFDYHPFPSPWGHPRARYDGREIGVIRVTRTGAASTRLPGQLQRDGAGLIQVATGDEWLTLRLLQVDGRYVRPEELLAPDGSLAAGEP